MFDPFLLSPVKLNHQVLHETLPVVSQLNGENWDQGNGAYHLDPSEFKPCCIGAHLARYFRTLVRGRGCYYFEDGATEFYKRLGIYDIEIADRLLFICGATRSPFGRMVYNQKLTDIWKRLMMIETIIDEDKIYDIVYAICDRYIYNPIPNIIVDKPELFKGVLEFNSLHPKFNNSHLEFNNLHLEFKKVKLNRKELALV